MDYEKIVRDFATNYPTHFAEYSKITSRWLDRTDCTHTTEVFRWYLHNLLSPGKASRDRYLWEFTETFDVESHGIKEALIYIGILQKTFPIIQLDATSIQDDTGLPEGVDHSFMVVNGNYILESWVREYEPKVIEIKDTENLLRGGFRWYTIFVRADLKRKSSDKNDEY